MDVAYLQQTKCVFNFNPIYSSTHSRPVSVPCKVAIINSRDYQQNARRSFRSMCLASSSDTLVSGKSSSLTVTSKKDKEFEEEEDLKS
ncbi:hypothetical protein L2E82_36540 [Cichorium intybus]|uniref:Uncharacterized protein n=1 Tax=Cichorium intybus TaxID=13427 RepID=A0ACB9BRY2_CICIN|nr:hypothetical protein L2E82_36540 [Cichorium intybus]